MSKAMQVVRLIGEGEGTNLARLGLLRFRNRSPHWFYSGSTPGNDVTLSQVQKIYLRQQPLWEQEVKERSVEVATLLSTNRPWRLKPTLTMLARQKAVNLQVLVATHGFKRSEDVASFARDLNLDVTWIEEESKLTLGEVYNRILSYVETPYIAKIDDDDFYGSYYLLDSVMQMLRSGAKITGKNSHFVFIESAQQVFLRQWNKAHRFVYWVPGGTIVAHTSLMKTLRFSSTTVGEDKDLLVRAFREGASLYSSSPFGFTLRRGADNTWKTTDHDMRAHARFIGHRPPGVFECVN